MGSGTVFRQDAYDFEDLICRVAPGGIIQFVLDIYRMRMRAEERK